MTPEKYAKNTMQVAIESIYNNKNDDSEGEAVYNHTVNKVTVGQYNNRRLRNGRCGSVEAFG